MGKGAGFLVFVAVFGLLASFVLFFEINYNYSIFDVIERTITGNAVSDMSDVGESVYVKSASDSEFVNDTVDVTITGNVVLDNSCIVERVKWNRKNAGFGNTVRLNIFGNENCEGHGVYARIFEDDIFGDDFIDNYQSYFIGLNLAMFMIAFSVSGIINAIIIMLPCYCILIFCYIGFGCVCIKNALERHRFGVLPCNYLRQCYFPMMFFICLGMLSFLIECWALSMILGFA